MVYAELISAAKYRGTVTYLDGLYPDGHLRQAKVNALRELQSTGGAPNGVLREGVAPVYGRCSRPLLKRKRQRK